MTFHSTTRSVKHDRIVKGDARIFREARYWVVRADNLAARIQRVHDSVNCKG